MSEGQIFAYFSHATSPGFPRSHWHPQPPKSCTPLCVQLPSHLVYGPLYYRDFYFIYCFVLHTLLYVLQQYWDIPSPNLQEVACTHGIGFFFFFSYLWSCLKKISKCKCFKWSKSRQIHSRLFNVREKSEELHLSDTLEDTQRLSFIYYRGHCWQQRRKSYFLNKKRSML